MGKQPPSAPPTSEFARQAQQTRPSLFEELWSFIRYNKKWWITPILLLLLFVGLLVALGSTAAAPLIYALW